MKALIVAAAVGVALAAPAAAEMRYDRKLEQAVMDIVARKMGELRGSFDHDHQPRLVAPPDRAVTGSVAEMRPPPPSRAVPADAAAAQPRPKRVRIIAF